MRKCFKYNVTENALKLEITDATTYGGRDVKMVLNITYVDDSVEISNIEWYKQGDDGEKVLLTTPSEKYEYENEDKYNGYLKIKNVQFCDRAEYICKVHVKGRPRIYECSGSLTTKNGLEMNIPDVTVTEFASHAKLLLNLKIDKSAKIIKVEWDKFRENGMPIPLIAWPSPNQKSDYECGFEDYDNSKIYLRFRNVISRDAGKYLCEVKLENNLDVSICHGTLTVQDALKLEIKDTTVDERGDAKLLLNITYVDNSVKISNTEWYKQGEEKMLTSTGSKSKKYKCGNKDKYNGYLNIDDVQFTDGGTYICKVKVKVKFNDEERTYECSGNLKVQGTSIFGEDEIRQII
ncbi:uncharacterized protein [Antedon mediterranea]|uniref:uncharacterized protein n=1 Tax=Antedon mediterranea TaxID=105859 RepID=UPI003AF98F2C